MFSSEVCQCGVNNLQLPKLCCYKTSQMTYGGKQNVNYSSGHIIPYYNRNSADMPQEEENTIAHRKTLQNGIFMVLLRTTAHLR